MMLERTGFAALPGDAPPRLAVVIDTEEEFDWSRPLSRDNTAVATIAAQHRAQDVFARHGVVPTYVIDYPVATNPAAARTLAGFLGDGVCEIGAHLHPWVNPPHEETVCPEMSYPGNLPPVLEREKLVRLTAAITENLGHRPTVYRAGRYGIGANTGAILEELGYRVDTSIVPHTSFTADGGPDFRGHGFRPYWFGADRRLLEIPLTAGFCGAFRGAGPALFSTLTAPPLMALHAPGICARLGLLERIRLSPEGIDSAALKRLTTSLLAQGCRLFTLSYHSPSLAPGNTPYVRDEAELRRFLDVLDGYFRFFFDDLGGTPTTPARVYDQLVAAPSG